MLTEIAQLVSKSGQARPNSSQLEPRPGKVQPTRRKGKSKLVNFGLHLVGSSSRLLLTIFDQAYKIRHCVKPRFLNSTPSPLGKGPMLDFTWCQQLLNARSTQAVDNAVATGAPTLAQIRVCKIGTLVSLFPLFSTRWKTIFGLETPLEARGRPCKRLDKFGRPWANVDPIGAQRAALEDFGARCWYPSLG